MKFHFPENIRRLNLGLEVPSRLCLGLRIFSTTKFLSNCTYTDKTNLQTILMCRRIQNGIIYPWGWSESRVYPWQKRDLISSRDKAITSAASTLRLFQELVTGPKTSVIPVLYFLVCQQTDPEYVHPWLVNRIPVAIPVVPPFVSCDK